mmetsp:Transcript_37605/g.65975  ORF Transcript_37605/g.65975 Transcript_37605/m.65975 type:complete len:1393 (-) Transcript_37605:32-4210(-)|eukprot:CAMPEP_0201865624 /NCGR_PEP_ID=MMETSP0902-20130614/447_1 /ASSEMBLY_ACC=CAM_ASM_000551 /TAXON_ID=420261 /ORGANISM="Thalassiosira antarctica, Strain CCMP982" /LENGTH=1392 /DNA_ID=CAMNT_0048390415 /DNA_START=20 /DNA_END=4201 /DNA_ORIENTATION=-
MASSYGPWSAVSTTADAANSFVDAATAATAAIDRSGIYSSNLVTSALSTIGDAQFFEESISPSTVRTQLVVTGDPSNPSTTLDLLKGMKWLLANMSKGRNVSDFFPHVVKLVGAPNLEVRKMVYIYLARYANHDNSCRELALLSINAFQRGLADREPLLRSLALRVLTCMDVPDVLQLQILSVRTCCKDSSPYVRKCAANAVAKLHPRCLAAGDGVQAEQLVNIVTNLLEEDGSTMVLTSAMIAFSEISPQRLDLLHGCYRKVCHLLTDMDEWGQVVVLDALMQYCRTFFKQPRGQKKGSAERIDQERRVTRTTIQMGVAMGPGVADGGSMPNGGAANDDTLLSLDAITSTTTNGSSSAPALPPRQKKKVKRRVVRHAFYSDEEDESSEEEVNPNYPITGGNVAGTLRDRTVLGGPSKMGNTFGSPSKRGNTFFRDDVNAAADGTREGDFGWKSNNDAMAVALDDDEDNDLHEDHKLLLQSSFPLLKSRNSAVVLAACSLHYHCDVASIKIRSALGKALVRIHRDRREIQYIVLVSIRTLVQECPSAFSPFLNDFFVKGMDPSFTRMIKLDILVSLCLDPKAIDAVLTELRTHVRHSDKAFACAAIRSVGKVAELARVVYDRRAHTAEELDASSARADSNVIVLNCLSGLVTLSEFSRHDEVVGECAETMQRILSQLLSDDGITSAVNDPAGIQERALKRLLLILIRSLNSDDINVDEEEITTEQTQLQLKTVRVPDSALASILWVIGEWLTMSASILSPWNIDEKSKRKIRLEVLRLLAKSFAGLNPQIKLQAVHLASKVLLTLKADQPSSSDVTKKECAISELILAMARVDVLQDVRDRARYEGNILHMSIGLSYDTSALQQLPPNAASVGVDTAKSMLLHRKPNASSLPLDNKEFGSAKNEADLFRFGTLNSILGNRTMGSTIPLPTWADNDSASALRDLSAANKSDLNVDGGEHGLYSSSSEDEPSSSSSGGSSSSSSSDSSEESEDESSDSESANTSDEDSGVDNTAIGNGGFDAKPAMAPIKKSEAMIPSLINNDAEDESSSDSSSDSSDESSESDESTNKGKTNADVNTKPAFGTILDMETANLPQVPVQYNKQTSSSSNVAAGLEDLVMAPLVANKDDISKPSTIDDESGVWKELVRPELSGGLFVKMRFVHGRSRAEEACVLGVDPKNPSTVCLQVNVENMRTDTGTLRHVRIVHRGGTSGGIISPSRVITPPEIPALKKGMASTVFIGLTFASASDRDGVAVAKFDVKSDRGSTSIEVRPTLGELLNDDATKTTSQPEFDAAISGLHGIQRISMTFTLSPMNDANYNSLPSTILQHLNLKQIGKWTGKGSFVGTLPASGQEVYVVVQCDSVTGYGDVTVCSNDAMAANSITNLLKQALTSLI